MTIVPLFGHADLRRRVADALSRSTLPSSLLLEGPRGVGKQRLGLWIAQLLVCETPAAAPCAACRACRLSAELKHPDLHWFFPRPRPKDTDPEIDDVLVDGAEAIAERVDDAGLYASPSGSDGIYIATVRAIVQVAAKSPAMARRKVFVIGDAERMVPQEGAEFAANAILKLLEEPPADTYIILTSSEPGALLPTIRSRVVTARVAPLSSDDVRQFLAHPAVAERLTREKDLPAGSAERIVFAAGAPGRLLSGEKWNQAIANAKRLLDSVGGKPAARFEAAWAQSSAKARGAFADSLDALSVALHERAQASVRQGAESNALNAARAMDVVEVAKERILSNVSPQLVTANLLRELEEILA